MSGAVEGVALLPCPFGHEFEAKYPPAPVQRMSWQKGLSEERCRVMCKCGAQGPVAEGSPAAIAAWNTRTTPPARSYADAIEDAAKAVEALRREVPYEYNRHPCSETKRRAIAAIRLLSQGGKP